MSSIIPGWYDPLDYGATFTGNDDNAVDDLPAFRAMLDDMPVTGGYVHMSGYAWISDTLRISKPVRFTGLSGTGGSNGVHLSGFRCAPGKTAIRLDGSAVSLDGHSAAFHNISGLDLNSQILVHGAAYGNAFGHGIHREVSTSNTIRLGDCLIAAASANATRFYRATAMAANGGRGPGTLAGTPDWPLIPGATVVSNGITWTTEAFPFVHETDHPYIVGERVYGVADNRFVYECIVAGTSSEARPIELQGGDDNSYGMTLGGTLRDGGVTWLITMAAGVMIASGLGEVRYMHITGFTGPAVTALGGTGQIGSPGLVSEVNNSRVHHIYAEYCGVGAYYSGENCNGWLLDALFAINIGTIQPTPDIVVAARYQGLGGHGLHDRSQASGQLSSFYEQTSTGRPILKNGTGRLTCLSCFYELVPNARNSNGHVLSIGGNLQWTDDSTGVIALDRDTLGRGVTEYDPIGAVPISARVSSRDGHSVFTMQAMEAGGSPDTWAWRYRDASTPAGWWGMIHGAQAPGTAFMISGAATGLDPSPGWLSFPEGYFIGPTNATLHYRGTLATIDSRHLRGGLRRAGDRFEDATTSVTVLTDGYRGLPWTKNTVMGDIENTPWGLPAYVVEPTANTEKTEGSEQVWKLTKGGTTHQTKEPVWPASPTPGITTTTDGSGATACEWTFLGYTPSMVVEQRNAKVRRHMRHAQVSTTTTTSPQVLITGGVVNGIDMTLPVNAIVRISDLIILKKPDTNSGGTIEIKSD